jgi:hypothetical protein
MTFNLDIVHDTERYFGESPKLNIRKYKGYLLYKYIKNQMDKNNVDIVNTLGLYRSVVLLDGRIVSFSPPKTMSADVMYDTYLKDTEAKLDEHVASFGEYRVRVEEFMEGTMVNVFHDGTQWRIATKSMIDANGKFFNREKSFSDMFYEIIEKMDTSLDVLNPEYIYSFVMQHPENRIVGRIESPRLCLTNVYKVDGFNVRSIDPRTVAHTSAQRPFFANMPSMMSFAEMEPEDFVDFRGLNAFIWSLTSQNNYENMGLVIYIEKYDEEGNKTFEVRGKLRNPMYEKVRHIRGNQPKLQYRYCELYLHNHIAEFLTYYPEYTETFRKFEMNILVFISTLYKYYRNCYIRKQKPLKEFEYAYRNHMFQIHQLYKTQLAAKSLKVEHITVEQYIKRLHPSQLMYSLSRMNGVWDTPENNEIVDANE